MTPLRMIPALALVFLTCGHAAQAGGVHEEVLAGAEAFTAGTLSGLSLGSDGVLQLGIATQAIPLEAATAWAAVSHAGFTWVGTGNAGRILRVGAEGKLERFSVPAALMVTALAPLPDGAVAAAVFPGGRIVRVSAKGEVAALATLPVEYIWALASDARGGLTVACGVPGSVYSVDPLGAPSLLAEVGDEHARCLTRRGDEWVLGTAPQGLVVAVKAGSRQVLRDLEAQEVVGVVALEDGSLLLAANADTAGGNAQQLGNLLRQIGTPPETEAGEKVPARESLQDGSVSHLETAGVLTPLWQEKKVAALTLVRTAAGAAVGTYPSGRVFHVVPGKAPALEADLPEAEASVLLPGLTGIVTSHPAVLHLARPALLGSFTSAPVDGEAPSLWGRITAQGRGVTGLEVRSGESAEPDESWSAWQAVEGFDGHSGRADVTGRLLQVRATLAGEGAELRSLALLLRTPNRSPVPSTFAAKHEGAGESGELPSANPTITLTWKVEDPDGDDLLTSLSVRREEAGVWRELLTDEALEKPTYAWDTTGWPDGRYQIRLVVSDRASNSTDQAREAQALLPYVTVDNTPPRLRIKAVRGTAGVVLVEGEAEDAPPGRILRLRASANGKDWVLLGAKDGLFDSASEAFSGTLSAPATGPVDIVVQALDAHGNVVSAAASLP